MLLLAVRRIPLAAWALFTALLPILWRTIDALWQLPFGSAGAVGLHDPDSWLRLTLVRDWLQGGSWYDHSYLSNAPNGPITSPWTRPLDIVIATLSQPQWGDLLTRLTRTAIILPMLWMTLLMGALLFAVRRLTPMPHAIPLLGVLLITAPINYNYFGPGNADHHAPLSVIFCWIVALVLNYDARRGNGITLMGLLLALMLWISPEATLLIGIIYGWFGLKWLAGGRMQPLARLATITTLATVVALMIERPPSLLLQFVYDSFSIAHVQVLAMIALACWLLTRITSFFWLWRALAGAALLAAIVAMVHFIDPKFFLGPVAQVDDYVIHDFLPRIFEARPAWEQPILKFLGLLIQPILALFVAFRCATQRNGILAPASAATLLYLLLTTLVLYFAQMRWAYYFFPLVPLVLAPYLASWLNPQLSSISPYWPATRLRRLSESQLMARRIPLLFVALVMPSILILTGVMLQKKAEFDAPACQKDVRRMLQNGEIGRIGGDKPLTIYAPTDLGAEILFFTPDRIIASNYHREGPGIKAVWDAQLSKKLDPLQKVIRERKVNLVILCPNNGAPSDAALHRLRAGTLKMKGLTPYRIETKDLSNTPPAIFLVKGTGR